MFRTQAQWIPYLTLILFQIDRLPSESAYQALDDLYAQPARPTMEDLHAGRVAKMAQAQVGWKTHITFFYIAAKSCVDTFQTPHLKKAIMKSFSLFLCRQMQKMKFCYLAKL